MSDLIPPPRKAHLRRIAAALPQPGTGLWAAVVVLAVMLIAAGAYGLRGTIAARSDMAAPPPAVAARLAVTLPSPAPDADTRLAARGTTGGGVEDAAVMVPPPGAVGAPQARSGLPHMPRLSRIFRGPPPAVPPARPSPEVRDSQNMTTAALRPRSRPETLRQQQAPRRSAWLRPRQRPEDLAVRAEPRARVAGQTPQARPDAPPAAPRAAPPPRVAALTASPESVRSSAQCPRRLSAAIPQRARDAAGAHAVTARLQEIDGVTRDDRVVRQILSGNMPGFLRDLKPVSLRGRAADGSLTLITLCVTPDYLALGSDADHTRIPLGLRAATRIGDAFNMMLPTPRIVDLIYRAADLRLSPRPMPAGPRMRSTEYLTRHNATVAAQIREAGAAPGALISGHKKDVVLTTRLTDRPGRVAIYGWHRANGQPIQPLSTVHGAGYADYSHGIRLVSRTAYLDGRAVDLRELLASPRYAALLSDEGPVTGPRLRMAALAAN
jgi:hypothetical protein